MHTNVRVSAPRSDNGGEDAASLMRIFDANGFNPRSHKKRCGISELYASMKIFSIETLLALSIAGEEEQFVLSCDR